MASKPTPVVDANGMPAISQTAFVGTVVCDLVQRRFRYFDVPVQGVQCSRKLTTSADTVLLRKDVAQYGNQYINSAGERAHPYS